MDIPEQFLVKIAQQLARSGFIEIVQGMRGGYRLLMSPENISLLDVVEAAVGEIFLNDCVMNPASCRRTPSCCVHMVWEKAREQLRDTLREATFQTLLAEGSCGYPPRANRKKAVILTRKGREPGKSAPLCHPGESWSTEDIDKTENRLSTV
jgi:Rrf2 family protein